LPEERIISPAEQVAVPLLAAVTYTDKDELREMFARLLAAAMDSVEASRVHPAFASIPAQLTSDEARLLVLFTADTVLRPRRLEQLAEAAGCSSTDVRLSLANLVRLQLV